VAPRQYVNFFTMPQRKTPDGRSVPVEEPNRTPRLVEEERTGSWNVNAYIMRERYAVVEAEAFLTNKDGET